TQTRAPTGERLRILRSLKNAGKVFHAQGIQRDDHWQPPDDLRDQAERFQVFGLHLPQQSIRSYLAVFRHLTESEPAPPETLGDDVFKTDEGSTADEQDVRRVEGHPRLLGVLVATPAVAPWRQRLRASSRGRAATLSNLDVAYGGSGGGTGSGTG
ncbi:MAG: hypothetical protein WBC80_25635, partial [Isosphaeraceae bacterium]